MSPSPVIKTSKERKKAGKKIIVQIIKKDNDQIRKKPSKESKSERIPKPGGAKGETEDDEMEQNETEKISKKEGGKRVKHSSKHFSVEETPEDPEERRRFLNRMQKRRFRAKMTSEQKEKEKQKKQNYLKCKLKAKLEECSNFEERHSAEEVKHAPKISRYKMELSKMTPEQLEEFRRKRREYAKQQRTKLNLLNTKKLLNSESVEAQEEPKQRQKKRNKNEYEKSRILNMNPENLSKYRKTRRNQERKYRGSQLRSSSCSDDDEEDSSDKEKRREASRFKEWTRNANKSEDERIDQNIKNYFRKNAREARMPRKELEEYKKKKSIYNQTYHRKLKLSSDKEKLERHKENVRKAVNKFREKKRKERPTLEVPPEEPLLLDFPLEFPAEPIRQNDDEDDEEGGVPELLSLHPTTTTTAPVPPQGLEVEDLPPLPLSSTTSNLFQEEEERPADNIEFIVVLNDNLVVDSEVIVMADPTILTLPLQMQMPLPILTLPDSTSSASSSSLNLIDFTTHPQILDGNGGAPISVSDLQSSADISHITPEFAAVFEEYQRNVLGFGNVNLPLPSEEAIAIAPQIAEVEVNLPSSPIPSLILTAAVQEAAETTETGAAITTEVAETESAATTKTPEASHSRPYHKDNDTIATWNCPKCQKPFHSIKYLSEHYELSHNETTTEERPKIDQKPIKNQNRSQNNKSRSQKFICMKCPKITSKSVFQIKDRLLSHVKQKHPQYFFPCPNCKLLKYNAAILEIHMKICSKMKNYL